MRDWMLYATGGLAYGGTRDSDQLFNPAAPGAGNLVGSTSETRVGWTVGAGAEWMFLPRWSVKAEYLHVDLGSSTVVMPDTTGLFPGTSATYGFSHRYDIGRVGVNLHF